MEVMSNSYKHFVEGIIKIKEELDDNETDIIVLENLKELIANLKDRESNIDGQLNFYVKLLDTVINIYYETPDWKLTSRVLKNILYLVISSYRGQDDGAVETLNEEQELFTRVDITAIDTEESREYFEKCGVRFYSDKELFLSEINIYPPDILFVNVDDDGIDGLNLVQSLMTEEGLEKLQNVAIMDYINNSLINHCLDVGIDLVINKPLNTSTIQARIKSCKQRLKRTMNLTHLDALTKIPNRRYFREELNTTFNKYQMGLVENFSIALIDLDRFKSVNDTYGHSTGDYLLVKFAQFLNSHVRKSDIIARWGGEEFIILFNSIDANQAKTILDRIREDFSNVLIEYEEFSFYQTFSAGVINVNKTITSTNEMIDLSDKALYASKENGRNQITVYSENMLSEANQYSMMYLTDNTEPLYLKVRNKRLSDYNCIVKTYRSKEELEKSLLEYNVNILLIENNHIKLDYSSLKDMVEISKDKGKVLSLISNEFDFSLNSLFPVRFSIRDFNENLAKIIESLDKIRKED